MNYKVIYGKNDLVYTGFLALPGKLYQKNELTQDYDTEYKLLHEKHTLSKYFNITPFVVIDKNSQMPVARCMLTYYPEDDVAYFGFFECIGQQEIAEQLLDTVSKKAKKDGNTEQSQKLQGSIRGYQENLEVVAQELTQAEFERDNAAKTGKGVMSNQGTVLGLGTTDKAAVNDG